MPIDIQVLSSTQADAVLAFQESHFGDLKAVDISPAKLSQSISAFANADGGEIYVGVDENKVSGARVWRGFSSVEDANAHIQVCEGLFPLGADFDYSFLVSSDRDGFVLYIQIRKTSDIKRASDGEVYVRRSAQNLRVRTPKALQALRFVKGLASFEDEVVDVEPDVISASEIIVDFMKHAVPSADPRAWLAKQRLIRNERPTVAGALLFSDEPQALLPKRCGIKIYRYKTKDSEGSRESLAFTPLTVEGCTYAQIKEAVERAIAVVEEIKRLGDETLEAIRYPTEAIHEIVTNAVLHRDYSVADDIHIRVFDNRIEVESPGRLPAHITPQNILEERFARNGNLVRLINKFPNPPNQDVGEGLNTAFAAMRKLGLKPPVISERPNSVLVSIKHEPLASPEQLILEYLENNDSIRNKTARQVCNINADYIVKDIFGRLAARGLIERVPGTDRGSTAYQKGPNFDRWRKTR